MKKIILPTDFSQNAENAISYALNLFRGQDCIFYLLNTFLPSAKHKEYYPWHNDIEDSTPGKSMKSLTSMIDRLICKTENQKYIFVPHSALNTMAGEIKKVIEVENIDLIVMGTQGATGAKNVIFGSNTVQTIKKLDRPIIAIPSNFKFKEPKNIVFPTDFEVSYSTEQLKDLLAIAKRFKSFINVLHIASQSGLSQVQADNKATLEQVLKDVEHQIQCLTSQNVYETVNSFQIDGSTDFLVMIRNKHTFYERLFTTSNIEKIGLRITVPFMVTPSLQITRKNEKNTHSY